MTAGEPGRTPSIEAFTAWARAWVNPVPALIERLGADRLPDAVRERAADLETALRAALAVDEGISSGGGVAELGLTPEPPSLHAGLTQIGRAHV